MHTPDGLHLCGEQGSQGMQLEHAVQPYAYQKCSHVLLRVKQINRWSIIHILYKNDHVCLLIHWWMIMSFLAVHRTLIMPSGKHDLPTAFLSPLWCCLYARWERKEPWHAINRDDALRTNGNPFALSTFSKFTRLSFSLHTLSESRRADRIFWCS